MPAALVMASVINLFRFAADQKLAPAAMLSHINNLLCERNSQNMFMTAVIGVIDTDNKAITLLTPVIIRE